MLQQTAFCPTQRSHFEATQVPVAGVLSGIDCTVWDSLAVSFIEDQMYAAQACKSRVSMPIHLMSSLMVNSIRLIADAPPPPFPPLQAFVNATSPPEHLINIQARGERRFQSMRGIPVDAAGTPGESGRPSVATPDPAWTRKESACPW